MARAWVRRSLLGAALLAAATWALFDEEAPAPTAKDARHRAVARAPALTRHTTQEAVAVGFDITRLDRLRLRTRSEREPGELFAVEEPAHVKAEKKLAASAPPPAPPPPPQAPDLPFRYLGSQESGGARTLFLLQQQETHIVSIGETIGNTWRLEEVNQRLAVFTYVPLGQRRTLMLGAPG